MDFSFSLSWQTVVTIVYGSLILRIAGRKSLSQMTIAQTIVMLAVGTVLIEPLVGNDLIDTFIVVAIAVLTLIIIEYAEIKFPSLKKLFTGAPVIIIEDGKINRGNLKQVRMTIQQVEMELRQANIAKVSEVKWATLEPNGQFGYVLKDEFQSISKQEYQYLLSRLLSIEGKLPGNSDTAYGSSILLSREKIGKNPDPATDEDVFEKIASEAKNS